MSFVTFVLLRTMFNLTVSLGGNLTQGRGLQRRRLSSFRFVRRGKKKYLLNKYLWQTNGISSTKTRTENKNLNTVKPKNSIVVQTCLNDHLTGTHVCLYFTLFSFGRKTINFLFFRSTLTSGWWTGSRTSCRWPAPTTESSDDEPSGSSDSGPVSNCRQN
jgi:hypothetical protein